MQFPGLQVSEKQVNNIRFINMHKIWGFIWTDLYILKTCWVLLRSLPTFVTSSYGGCCCCCCDGAWAYATLLLLLLLVSCFMKKGISDAKEVGLETVKKDLLALQDYLFKQGNVQICTKWSKASAKFLKCNTIEP